MSRKRRYTIRCPKCGELSKEEKIVEDGIVKVYCDCVNCGKILVNQYDERKAPISLIKGFYDQIRQYILTFDSRYKKYTFIAFVLILILLSGLSYYLYDQLVERRVFIYDLQIRYSELNDNYLLLMNTTASINAYYEEIQERYNNLTLEYQHLEDRFDAIYREKKHVDQELNEIILLQKTTIFEDNKTIELPAKSNVTLTYDALYAGYLVVNYTSSGEIVFWLGSSITENRYYARYPSFPDTTKQGSIKIPVCSTVYVFILNPNDEIDIMVNLDIQYFY